MSMVAKILVVLNLLLAVAVMGAAGAYLQSAENWKKNYDDTKLAFDNSKKDAEERYQKVSAALDEAKRAKETAVSQAAALEAQAKTLSENNTLNQKKLSDFLATLGSMEARLKDLQQNLDASRQDNARLSTERKTADDEKRAALEKQNAAETEQKRLQNELDNTAKMLDASQKNGVALADKLEATATALHAYKVKFGDIGMAGAPVKGQVLAADPSMDIYLISVGEKDGVQVAQELTVYRGDQFVALVVVDKVFADKASVYVKKMNGAPMKKGDIRQGDKVATVF